MNNARTIFFVGKPGCGKGTQAKRLAALTSWPIISAGGQFRAIAAEDTPVGKKVKEEYDAGLLQPHWLAMYLYLKALFSLPADANVIFDGFNRKEQEAQLVVDSLAWLGRSCVVVNLAISDEVSHARIAKRSEIDVRADDLNVDQRLIEYRVHTEPAIALFRAQGTLIDIDGEQDEEAIAKSIAEALELS